ncbi:MAG: rod shape-determining protein MreC [Pseudomonadota bacterium]
MRWFSGKRKILNFIIPLVLALIFFSLSSSRARSASWYESAILNLLSPIQGVVSFLSNRLGSVWDKYFYLVEVSEQNKELIKDNARLQSELIRQEDVIHENQRLRSLLEYKQAISYPTKVARVIANDPRADFKSITINKGRKHGVKPLMPVIGSKGLVGHVGKVATYSAQVLLIIDPNSAVDVLDQRSRAAAVLIGTAKKTELKAGAYISRLEYLRRVSDIKESDIIVTSGFDQVYPRGIPVGTIHNIVETSYGVFQEAEVVPFENFAELEEVLVILKDSE